MRDGLSRFYLVYPLKIMKKKIALMLSIFMLSAMSLYGFAYTDVYAISDSTKTFEPQRNDANSEIIMDVSNDSSEIAMNVSDAPYGDYDYSAASADPSSYDNSGTSGVDLSTEEAADAVVDDGLIQSSQTSVLYRAHVQKNGWEQDWKQNGVLSGTQGESKRLEGIEIKVSGNPNLGVRYKSHVQTNGWETEWKENGELSGTEGQSKRIEAIRIELTGSDAYKYDVWYCVHAQHFGWLNWACNGASAGTTGFAYRLEGIKILILPKESNVPANEGTLTSAFYSRQDGPELNMVVVEGVAYNTHVQSDGWQEYVMNGEVSGTCGQSKRMEGVHIELINQPYSGDIEYRTHVQGYGWQEKWRKNGDLSGTIEQSKRMEAIQVRLTGEMAEHYDVYYRVHVRSIGWLGWGSNGESAGTAGFYKRLEAIQIILVDKGSGSPGNVGGIVSVEDESFFDKTNASLFEMDGSYAGIEANLSLTGSGSGCHAKINIHDSYGAAVSFGIQYESALSSNHPYATDNNVAFLVENVMSHGTEPGLRGKEYHFLGRANLGQEYKMAISWYDDNSLRFYLNGDEYFRTTTTLTPPLFFQVEGSAMKNGDTINALFTDVRVKAGNCDANYGIVGEWNDQSFDFFGLDAMVKEKGVVINNGQWSTNGMPTSGITAFITGTANVGGGADWDTCFLQPEPKTGETGLPLSGIVMIAQKQ